MTDTTDQHPVTVALSKQLEVATDINACFCIGCGQPDEPELHDPARCPAREGGKLDVLTVADALEVYDTSCDEEPDLDGDARALHCAIVATRLASVSSASAIKASAEVSLMYLQTGFIECPQCGEEIPTEDLDAAYELATVVEPAPTIGGTVRPEPVPATNQAGEVERLRAALERIRDTRDNLVPSVTIQGMRNIAGFALLGEVLP